MTIAKNENPTRNQLKFLKENNITTKNISKFDTGMIIRNVITKANQSRRHLI